MKLLTFLFPLYFFAMLVDARTGEIRIDEEKQYEEYQDIKRALDNEDRRSWLYYRTYSREPNGVQHTCVFALVEETKQSENVYEFQQGYMVQNEQGKQEVKDMLLATTYKTPYREDREKDNAMNVTRREGSAGGKGYQLIYSDYKECDILRVLSGYGSECELYLHDRAVNKKVPPLCERVYENACGGKYTSSYKRQVYNNSCKGPDEGPSGPISTKAPQQPEEPNEETTPETQGTMEDTTTTSTVAPGC
uniref:Putative lipocalin-2 1 n=1 Tax=Ixodes ricinus TaxID=34613 RepID=V5HBZ1_IXORI